MFKSILISIFFLLFVYSLFFPAAVKAQQCVDPDPTGAIPCGFECTIGTTDSQTKCCSTQNDCYNLQQTEGPGSNPVAPAPNPAAPTIPRRNVAAAGVTITTIGDLDVGQSKTVTITGLTPEERYYTKISKGIYNSLLNTDYDYRLILENCFNAVISNETSITVGPYTDPGIYKIEIHKAASDRTCAPDRGGLYDAVLEQNFAVGGETSDRCCTLLSIHPRYNQAKDVCNRGTTSIANPISIIAAESATNCYNKGTFCEPDSVRCFKSKTIVSTPAPAATPCKGAGCTKGGGESCEDKNDGRGPGFKTAIGCIHTNPVEFVKDFMKFIIAIAGGLAFLLMLLGAFQMVTSAGNPDSLNAGRERLTNAIIGLLFVIFAVLLMQIIGVGILNIPGFK